MSKSKSISNMRELRDVQLDTIILLKDGKIDAKVSSEIAKQASGVMKGVGQQLQIAKARKEKPAIGFMKCK